MFFGDSRCSDRNRNTKTPKVTGKLTDVVGFDIRRREANGHHPGVSHDTKLWSYGGDMKGHAVYEGFNWVRQVHSPQIGYRHSETAVITPVDPPQQDIFDLPRHHCTATIRSNLLNRRSFVSNASG